MLRLKDAGAVLFHREIWGPRSLLRGQHPGPQIYPDPFPETLERGSRVKLFYETKANLRFEQLATLWKGGVRWIQPGIESFSNPVLRLMKKGTTAFQNIQLLRWCRELGGGTGLEHSLRISGRVALRVRAHGKARCWSTSTRRIRAAPFGWTASVHTSTSRRRSGFAKFALIATGQTDARGRWALLKSGRMAQSGASQPAGR